MTALIDWITAALMFTGLVFCLIASFGLVRMPDLYNRMQAATKAGTLGVALVVIGVALKFATSTVLLEATLIIGFFFATAPIASHLVARAAYGIGIRLDERTNRDDLASYRKAQAERPPAAPDPIGETTTMRFADHADRRSA